VSSVSEPSSEYSDVPEMVRQLTVLDKNSVAFGRRREAVIERVLPLAEHVARRFTGRGEPHDDLFQVACVGLINAVNRFDPDTGADFLSFAVPTVMGEVRRYFRDNGWAVKVPRRLKELRVQLGTAREELTQQNGRTPTATEIADYLDVDCRSVTDATIADAGYSASSIDVHPSSDDEFSPICDTLGEPDAALNKVVDIETVRPLIAALPERERKVLALRFAGDMTQDEIAQLLGYSQMHISRLLTRALNTLREQVRDDGQAADAQRAALRAGTPGREHHGVVSCGLKSAVGAAHCRPSHWAIRARATGRRDRRNSRGRQGQEPAQFR
jgi:RNA polymerase sigma-B factor